MNESDELLAVFRDDVGQQLSELRQQLSLPTDQWNIGRLFSYSHNVKGVSRMMGFATLEEAAHALEDLFSAVRSGRTKPDEVREAIEEGARLLQGCFEQLGSSALHGEVRRYRGMVSDLIAVCEEPQAAERPLEVRDASSGSAAQGTSPSRPSRGRDPRAAARHRSEDEAVEASEPAQRVAEPADAPTRPTLEAADTAGAAQGSATGGDALLRVTVEKLESVTELGAELIILGRSGQLHRELAQDIVTQLALLRRNDTSVSRNPAFRRIEQLSRRLQRDLAQDGGRSERLSAQLEEAVRALRMVRLDTIGTLLQRVVQGACQEHARRAELLIDGGATELDRVVLDGLRDPLIHLVRNAIAHGIEEPEERQAAGKRPIGRVTLAASSSGAWLDVVVHDDGRGIDIEAIRRQAVERNLLSAADAETQSEQDLLELVFLPGFSTAKTVTPLAGRGVGMDVVRTQMLKLGGRVSIASKLGHGTEIHLQAPLTRLTARGIVVRVGPYSIAVPTLGIERALQIRYDELRVADGEEAIRVGAGLVPVGTMARSLGLTVPPSEQGPALLLSDGSRRRALIVDEVLGEREFTIQPLPWHLEGRAGITGATVFEGGEIALVVDVQTLVSKACAPERRAGEQRQYRILVVDDSITSRTLEHTILTTGGYEVLTAVNGVQALDLLSHEAVDLVVSDVDMPEMNGFELTRQIRSSSRLHHLPVVLVTSLGDEANVHRGAEAGANAHIVKGTFDQDALLSTVARLL